jgi:transcriptional regulator with GAF, ATPase, and Fis domain
MPMFAHASDGNVRASYLVSSGAGTTECQRPDPRHPTSARHLNTLRLIGDLAVRFITVDADEMDTALHEGLRDAAQLLQLDQAMLWRTAPGEVGEAASHCWIGHHHPLRPDPLHVISIPLITSKLQAGEAAWFTHLDEVFDPVDRGAFLRHGVRSAAIVPVAMPGAEWGGLAFVSTTREHDWTPETIEQLKVIAGVFGQAMARKAGLRALQSTRDEIQRLRQSASEGDDQPRPDGLLRGSRLIVTTSPIVLQALAQAEQVAPTPATVLLLGETGVGKQMFAQAIHELSPRRQRPMVRVNCAAIPSALIESELFGRERGAYTGAVTRQIGRFETANLSTIFLDEIGELPAEVQVKLLSVLHERVIERLGSSQSIKVDVRIIAATNRNLEKAVEDKSFREDLFYRLNVFPIVVPPLRDRAEDIPGLAWEFIDEFSKSLGKPIESIAKESMRQLQAYSWPGNVRELRNVIERAVILATGARLTVPVPQAPGSRQAPSSATLMNVETDHIRATLESTNWRIRGEGGAAERLGLKPTTLESRMAKLGLVRPALA